MPEPLATTEVHTLAECEAIIEKGHQTFVEVGDALNRIRLEKLYRADFETFEAYCQERWGWSRQRASQLIGAAQVVNETKALSTTVDIPTEAAARELKSVPVASRPAVLDKATQASKGGKVTAAAIKEAKAPMARPASFGRPAGDAGDAPTDGAGGKEAPKSKNGREVITAKMRKEAEAVFGKLVRLLHDMRLKDGLKGELETILASIKGN